MGAATIRSEGHEPATVAPPPGNPRFPLLDGLRAVAAGLVLVFHGFALGNGHAGRVLHDLSQEGIAIFFVLSGFLLYGPFVRARVRGRGLPSVRAYAIRRAIRIVPAYWLALTFALLVAGATSVTAGHIPVYYLLLQDYLDATRYHGLAVAWTLSIEATFYALLPLLAYLAIRLARWTRGGVQLLPEASIVAGFIVVAAAVHLVRPGAPATILSYTDWFAGGMLLALIAIRLGAPRSLPAPLSIGSWLVAVAAFLVEISTPYGSYGSHLLLITAAVAIVTPAVFPAKRGPVTALLRVRSLRWLGVISYGIYLWHLPIMAEIENLHRMGAAPLLALGAVLTVLVAAASYRFVEAPLIQRFRSRTGSN